jgi:hypothetical protein
LCHDPSATARKGGGPSVGMTSDASVFSTVFKIQLKCVEGRGVAPTALDVFSDSFPALTR